MKYIIPAVLALIVGLILWQIQRDTVSLDYEIVESASFPRESGIGQYFIIRLRNSGTKQVEKVNLVISFSAGLIESKSFSNPDIISKVSVNSSEIRGLIPLLNPGELLSTTITMIGESSIPPPQVRARAPGASAVLRSDSIITKQLLNLFFIAIGFVLTLALYAIYTTYRSSRITDSISKIENLGEVSQRLEKTEEDIHAKLKRQTEEFKLEQEKRAKEYEEEKKKRDKEHDDAMKELKRQQQEQEQGKPRVEQIMFSLFNRAGLSHLFSELVGSAEGIAYWKTGLFLMNAFLVDDENRDKYIKAAEMLVKLTEMAPSSLGFNLYLLGKMEQINKNNQKAITWFEECKSKTPLMYEHLMTQDPAYDIEKVRKHLFDKTNNRMHSNAHQRRFF